MSQLTKRDYETALTEAQAVGRDLTALWLKHVKPAQAAYEAEVRQLGLASRQASAQRTIEAYERAHPTRHGD